MARILIVDDEHSIRVTLSEFLRDAGYEVSTAEDANEAIDMLLAEDFDVVLSDIIMPRITGVGLLKAIKETSPYVQVILITGEPTVETAAQAVRAGAFDYLTKPINKTQLIKTTANAAKVKSLDDERRRLAEENRQYQENLEQLVEERTKSLRESEEKYRHIVELSPNGIVMVSFKGEVLSINRAFTEITGFVEKEIVGKHFTEVPIKPKALSSTVTQTFSNIIKEKKVGTVEFKWRHKNGETRVGETRFGIMEKRGKNESVQFVLTDITERVRAEAEIKHATDEIKRLYRASGALLASASPNLHKLGDAIVGAVLAEFEHTNCSLILVQPGSQQLERIAAAGPYAEEVSQGELSLDGGGLVSLAIISGKIINISDVTESQDYIPHWESAQSELVVPLKIESHVVGVIDIQSADIGAFTPNDERLMSLFAERAAMALENTRLFRDANQRLERLDSLRKIDQALTGSLDLKVILNVLLGHLLTQLEVDAATVLRYEKALQTLTFFTRQGFRTTALQHTNLRLGQGHAGEAALQRRPVFIPDLSQPETSFSESREFKEEGFVAYYSVPLIAKAALVGVLEVFHRSALDPGDEWVDYLKTLAGQAAIAIDNITLFDDLQRSNTRLVQAYDATIEGWAQALEMRDMETEGHSRRVVELTIELADMMGIKGKHLMDIRRGALLHDIGKMGVPDAILQKPEKLSDEEWQIMYQHPVYAYEWLSSIEYLRPALDIPYCHHEKWDGTGYPRGLKGEQIPLAARIFAVVDVWDALCSNRPYRKAWSKKKALKDVQEQSGIHFDPQVVEAFLKVLKDVTT